MATVADFNPRKLKTYRQQDIPLTCLSCEHLIEQTSATYAQCAILRSRTSIYEAFVRDCNGVRYEASPLFTTVPPTFYFDEPRKELQFVFGKLTWRRLKRIAPLAIGAASLIYLVMRIVFG